MFSQSERWHNSPKEARRSATANHTIIFLPRSAEKDNHRCLLENSCRGKICNLRLKRSRNNKESHLVDCTENTQTWREETDRVVRIRVKFLHNRHCHVSTVAMMTTKCLYGWIGHSSYIKHKFNTKRESTEAIKSTNGSSFTLTRNFSDWFVYYTLSHILVHCVTDTTSYSWTETLRLSLHDLICALNMSRDLFAHTEINYRRTLTGSKIFNFDW